jgi:hypothetical protein
MEYYYQKQVLPAEKSISDAAGDCFQSQGRTGGHGHGQGGVRGRLEMVENIMQKKRNVDIISYFSSLWSVAGSSSSRRILLLLNLGRMEGEEDSDADSDKEDSDDEDGVQVLVVDEDSARIH